MEPRFMEIFGMQNLLGRGLEKADSVLKHDKMNKQVGEWLSSPRKATGASEGAQEWPQPSVGPEAMTGQWALDICF